MSELQALFPDFASYFLRVPLMDENDDAAEKDKRRLGKNKSIDSRGKG